MKATPTTTVEEPHEITLVPMVRQGRRYKRHIRTRMQHGRGAACQKSVFNGPIGGHLGMSWGLTKACIPQASYASWEREA